MAQEIWSGNDPVVKHRGAPAPKRRDPWDDARPSGGGKWLLWGGIVIVAILALVLIGRPAVTGYRTYRVMQDSGVPEEYALRMTALQQATAAMDSARAASQQCATDRDAAKAQYDAYVASFQEDIAIKDQAISACEDDLETQEPALKDAARRICCVQRVDNPAITGYEIQDGRVVCVAEGGESISC